MNGGADMAPKDGKVSVGELFEYVRRNATGDKQHRAIGTTPFDRSLPLAHYSSGILSGRVPTLSSRISA